jgi:hypothetical protein
MHRGLNITDFCHLVKGQVQRLVWRGNEFPRYPCKVR